MRIAIGDLGSNSFHMALFAVKNDSTFTILDRKAELNRLGQYLAKDVAIPSERITESAQLVKTLCTFAHEHAADRIYLYGTGIFRHGKNSHELVDAIVRIVGVRVHILSEAEEISLNVSAVKHYHDLVARTVIIDIGGGSSEFIIVEKNEVVWAHTVRLGTASIIEHMADRPRTAPEWNAVLQVYEREVCGVIPFKNIAQCIGTSGFMKVLSCEKQQRYCDDAAEVSTIEMLTHDDIVRVLHGEFRCDDESRKAVVEAGSRVLDMLFTRKIIQNILISCASTREGYLIQLLHKGVIS